MRFGRFSLVGLLGAVLQLGVVFVLTKRIHWTAVVATPIAVEIAVLHNFLWHERFTWRDQRAQSRTASRLWRFHASNGLVSILGSTFVTCCFVDLLKVPIMFSSILAIACCSAANFVIADRWVYAHGRGSA